MKIIFFGTPVFAIPVLKALLDNGNDVVGIFTSRGPMELEAQKYDIKVFMPSSLKDSVVFEQFKNLEPDLCIVAAYGKIIPPNYLTIPKYGFLNAHPSLLPKYRGPSPVQTAILNGDTETGTSIMIVDEQVDHGPVLAKQTYSLQTATYNLQASEELFTLGGKLLVGILPKYINGEMKPEPQNDAQATFTKILSREDGRIDWSRSAEQIYNQIRALNPNPGTWTRWPARSGNNKILNIKIAENFDKDSSGLNPGTITRLENNIAVATKKCYLILKQIQLEGGKEMDAKSFLNGHPDFLSSKLE